MITRCTPLFLAAALGTVLVAVVAFAQKGDPRDTGVAFTIAWAKHLADFRTLTDLQRAAGGNGSCVDFPGDDGETWKECRWRSIPMQVQGVGYMVATIRPNGRIGVSVSTVENALIVINNKGAFVCDDCKPRIDIEPPGSDDLSR
jgi:hypothetical protein